MTGVEFAAARARIGCTTGTCPVWPARWPAECVCYQRGLQRFRQTRRLMIAGGLLIMAIGITFLLIGRTP